MSLATTLVITSLNVSMTCAPRPLPQLHGFVVKVRQRGHCVILIDTLRNVIMLACAVVQYSAELDPEIFDIHVPHSTCACNSKRKA